MIKYADAQRVASNLAEILTVDILAAPPEQAARFVMSSLEGDEEHIPLVILLLRSWARSPMIAQAGGVKETLTKFQDSFLALSDVLEARKDFVLAFGRFIRTRNLYVSARGFVDEENRNELDRVLNQITVNSLIGSLSAKDVIFDDGSARVARVSRGDGREPSFTRDKFLAMTKECQRFTQQLREQLPEVVASSDAKLPVGRAFFAAAVSAVQQTVTQEQLTPEQFRVRNFPVLIAVCGKEKGQIIFDFFLQNLTFASGDASEN